MDKYGVQEKPTAPGEKIAGPTEHPTCPNCHKRLENLDTIGVKKCPQCGTKPFEGK